MKFGIFLVTIGGIILFLSGVALYMAIGTADITTRTNLLAGALCAGVLSWVVMYTGAYLIDKKSKSS